MKAVKHPNCVRFIECYESSGKFYIVMVSTRDHVRTFREKNNQKSPTLSQKNEREANPGGVLYGEGLAGPDHEEPAMLNPES